MTAKCLVHELDINSFLSCAGAKANLDGKYLLRSSDPTLSATDIAVGLAARPLPSRNRPSKR
jgi:hypothetical protein